MPQNHEEGAPVLSTEYHVDINAQGPYLVYGKMPVKLQVITPNHEGNSWTFRVGKKDYRTDQQPVALCRCGASKNKPYCDRTHASMRFRDGIPIELPDEEI